MTDDVLDLIHSAISGNVRSVTLLASMPDSQLVDAASQAGQLAVTSKAVLRALESYQHGEVSGSEVQHWAWFLMRGYIPSAGKEPTAPVTIHYDHEIEDEIVATLVRLSELGDMVDGTLEPGELEELARRLAAK